MPLKHHRDDDPAEPKKRKRVVFAEIDSGIDANECIKIFAVASPDEVGGENCFCFQPVDVNHFFEEPGKIYGHKGLEIKIWLSVISFHAYAEIKYESTFDGGKGITDLKHALEGIFGENLVEKEDFLETFSKESIIRNIISSGELVLHDVLSEVESPDMPSEGDFSTAEVVRIGLQGAAQLLYSSLLPLVLLLVDGGRPIDVSDPRWDLYVLVEKVRAESADGSIKLLGFATVYRFYHYPDSMRLRISQILVLPPYQGQGHGCRLLRSVNSVAEKDQNIYDVTAEEPSDYLQYLRTITDTIRLCAFEPIKPAVSSLVLYLQQVNLSKRSSAYKLNTRPPADAIKVVCEKLKINKKLFLRCWEVLVYLGLDPSNQKFMDNFRSWVSDRIRNDILDKGSELNGKRLIQLPNSYGHDMTFVMFRFHSGVGDSSGTEGKLGTDQSAQEEQLNMLVNKQMEEVAAIAQNVTARSNS